MKIDVAQQVLLGGPAAASGKDNETRRNVWLRDFESAMLRRGDSSPQGRAAQGDTPHALRHSRQDLPREADRMAPPPVADTCEPAGEGWHAVVPPYGSHALRAPTDGEPKASAPVSRADAYRAGGATEEADNEHVPLLTRQPDVPKTEAVGGGSLNAAVDATPEVQESRSAGAAQAPLAPPVATQRMHLTRHGDGADLWIRDARLPASRLAEVVQRAVQTMRASGLRIYHATVNGKPVLAEPPDDAPERRHEIDGFARDARFSYLETKFMHRDPWFAPRRRLWR